jgi:hypothetical protein
MDGICTLGNDGVYDSLLALLNSIEVQLGSDFPICIYPYDHQLERLKTAISDRPNVMLYEDQSSIERWDNFAQQAWDYHPTAKYHWRKAGSTGYHRFGTHRRFCAFDGPFERFLYMDADTLLLGSVDDIFEQLTGSDCVVYDFQYKDPTHIYEINSPHLTQIFAPSRLQAETFCSGFYASHRQLFSTDQLGQILSQLRGGEAEILYPFAPDQSLLNYLMMRSEKKINNLALTLPPTKRTGCCVTSEHFQEKEHLLYDRGKRLTYLHYIGLPKSLFSAICAGENLTFPYREIFLYYRYLHKPEQYPQFKGKAIPYKRSLSLWSRFIHKGTRILKETFLLNLFFSS